MTPGKKYYRFGMWLCSILALALVVLILVALVSGVLKDPNWVGLIIGAATSAVGCIYAGLFCRNQARKYSEVSSGITAGENVLAHWSYFDTEWLAFTELDYQIDKKQKYKACLWLTVYFALATVILVLVYPKDSSNYYFLISVFSSMIILIWLVTFTTLRLNYRHNKHIKGETIIASDALKFNGRLYAWNTANQELIRVEYMEGPPPMLAFKYGKMLRRGRSQNEVRVPIPYGKEEKARDIIQFFQDALGQSVMAQIKNGD